MNERGWGWSASEIRQMRLAEWLAGQQAGGYLSVTEFYDALPDQAMNTWDVAHSDLKYLEQRSMISLSATLGGMQGLHVMLHPGIRDLAEELQDLRANRRMRRAASRDAMVDWLHQLDALRAGPDMPATESMLEDPRHGIWFAEPFTAGDLYDAAAWLQDKGLVDGISAAEVHGPIRLYLTDAGVTCVEEYESDTGRYVQAREQQPTGGQVVNFLGNASGVQVARDYARQEQHIGASGEELRTKITGLAELVAGLVPGTADVAQQTEVALAAAQDGAVEVSVVRRFRDWALGVLGQGANAAAVKMVTIGADDMVQEAVRIAGHH
jgi:hypothetical protein